MCIHHSATCLQSIRLEAAIWLAGLLFAGPTLLPFSAINPVDANELRQVFGEPALVGSETLEVYEKLLSSIGSAIKPTDPITYLLTKDVTYWHWEMRREQIIKAEIIKYYQKEVVAELIKKLAPEGQLASATYRIFLEDDDFTLWATDPKARAEIDKALAVMGHSTQEILAQAYIRGATQIEAIDRRIAAYERRRNTALKEAKLWNDGLARRLERATTAIIDGEFTEAAEAA